MIRRLPILPTLIVLAAVATMMALGFWQIRRGQEKERMIANIRAAQSLPEIAFPMMPSDEDALPLFRKAKGACQRVVETRTSAGTNRSGETGFVFIADCATGAGPGMSVEIGWSKNPQAKSSWAGGPVSGLIVPDSRARIRLVSDQGLGGLEPSAAPTVESIPNNHRSYAVQWFLFAAIALVIYGLAVTKKLKPAA